MKLTLTLGVFLFTHLLWLNEIPGFHYDEGWSANFALRIATEPGFWPFHAMSAYTSPWVHYWIAAFFNIFEPTLWVFRFSQTLLVFFGVTMISLALRTLTLKRASIIFPLLLAFFPATWFNHHFGIEINTLHVFCFGLFFLSVVRGWYEIAGLSAFIGITTHALFLAPALATLLSTIYTFSKKERKIPKRLKVNIIFWILSLSPFFLHTALNLPRPGKAWALLVLSVIFILLFLFYERLPVKQLISFLELSFVKRTIPFLLLPFVATLLFFSEGSWSMALSLGYLPRPYLSGWGLVLLLIVFFESLGALKQIAKNSLFLRSALIGFILMNTITCLIMLKPAPRYLEIPLLCLAVLWSISLSLLPSKRALTLLAGFSLITIVQFSFNTLFPKQMGLHREAAILFSPFNDSSRDFLPKQALMKFLADKGCAAEQIMTNDSRIDETLRFLSISHFPVAGSVCPWQKVLIERDFNDPKRSNPVHIFGFILSEYS